MATPEFQWVDSIQPVAPSPSLLTVSRDRTSDGFGQVPGGLDADTVATLRAGDPDELARIQARLTSWRTGITWSLRACQPSYAEKLCPAYDPDDPEDRRHAPADNDGPVHVAPFKLYAPLSCQWTSQAAGQRLADDARGLLSAHTARGIARALWLGEGLDDLPGAPTLRRSATNITPVPGTPIDLDDAVAALLAAYDDCTGGSGGAVLHIPGTLMVNAQGGIPGGGTVARMEGNFYRGPLGSVISPGPGYPHGASSNDHGGFGPLDDETPDEGVTPSTYLGNAADQVWVYVTGPLEYAAGEIVVMPEREEERRNYMRTNTYEVWAERMAIVRFDPCCVFAVLVHDYADAELS